MIGGVGADYKKHFEKPRAGITQRLPRMLGLWLLPLADGEGVPNEKKGK